MEHFISLCMIVRDEEKVIERCLSSVKHLVDEIILVDTGSTDKTKEIASKYTSNIYEFNWINDFSAARNFASSKALGKWILVLDADEYVDQENFKAFIIELQEDEDNYDVYSTKIINFTGNVGEHLAQNFHERVYKNTKEIFYNRKVHEQIVSINNETLKNKTSSLTIFHSGYLNSIVQKKEKNKRNKELLDEEINKGDNKAFDYFNFGNEYSSIGEYEKALNSYLMAYKLKSDFRLSWVSVTLVQIVVNLINLKRYNDALSVINDGENIYNSSPEFPYLKGLIYFSQGRTDDSKEVFSELVSNTHLYDQVIIRMDFKEQNPHMKLGEIFLYEKDYSKAIYHFTSVLNINKNNEKGIRNVLFILNKFHSVKEISEFLNKKNLLSKTNIQSYVRVCLEIGNVELALELLTNFMKENKILHQVALLKRMVIEGTGNTEEIQSIFDSTILRELAGANWINIVDVFLFKKILNKKGIKNLNFNSPINLASEELELFLECKKDEVEIKEEYYLSALQIFINYSNFKWVEKILNKVKKVEESTIAKVAAMLFENGYEIEALQLYESVNWNYFSEQDFINIIDSLVSLGNQEDVVQVTYQAMNYYKHDYRFYKILIKNTGDKKEKEKIIIEALKFFPESNWLKSELNSIHIKKEKQNKNSPVTLTNLKQNKYNQELQRIHREKNALHIVYVVNHVKITGGAKVIFEHANRLSALGVSVSIVSHYPKPDWFDIKSSYIEVPPDRPLTSGIPVCDIIIATYWDQLEACMEIPNCQVVYFEQGDLHLFGNGILRLDLEEYIYKQIQLVPYILTVSKRAAILIKKKYNKESIVIHNAIDKNIFNNQPASFKPLEKQSPYILMMGSDKVIFKGIKDIIEGVNLVKKQIKDIKLIWVSPDEPSIEISNQVDKVFIAPSQNVISQLYKSASLFISASYYETFSLPVLEAMACGCPVVTTGNEGALEYTENNKNGLIINMKDPNDIYLKILKVLSNKELRDNLVSQGKETADKFDWDNTIMHLNDFYTRVAIEEKDFKSSLQTHESNEENETMYGTYIGDNKMLIKTLWGGHLSIPSHDLSIAPSLITSGVFEMPLTRFLLNSIKEGDIVFDVGANIGYYTVLLGMLVGDKGKVIAYEPNPVMFQFLIDNIGSNYLHNQVYLENKAVYSSNTELDLHISDKYNGHSSIFKREEKELREFDAQFDLTVKTLKVKAEPLEKYSEIYQEIDLIKIDVEGGEYAVFLGMKEMIEKNGIKNIVFEWNKAALGEQVTLFSILLNEISIEHEMFFYFLDGEGLPIKTSIVEIEKTNFIPSILLSKTIF